MIEVIYENGVLRPVEPLDYHEGTQLEITVNQVGDMSISQQADIMSEADHAALIAALDAIANLPLQSEPQPHLARDHDAILYPK